MTMSPGRDAIAPLIFHKSVPLAPPPSGARAELAPILLPGGGRPRKPFTRRRRDQSQHIRTAVQLGFMAVTLIVGVQFYFWVRYYETAGRTWKVARPPGVEAWLPIAALMNLKDFLLTRTVPEVHPAGMFMLVAFLAISWMYRKSFCSWICPVGTISEWLWKCGEATFDRSFVLPRWFDIPLRSLKYVLFALFAYVVVTMPVPEIREFLTTPYGLVADVKMLDFFRRMGRTTAIVLSVLVLLSVVVKNFWCRYLCPYGAMTGLVALISPTRIRRDPDACIDCAKCAKACPAGLPVDTALSIRSAECTACMSCVAVCPAVGALDLKTGLRRHAAVPPWALAAAITVVFLGIVGYARAAGYWHTDLPDDRLFHLIPRAEQFSHPR
jgi:polyferredoxin